MLPQHRSVNPQNIGFVGKRDVNYVEFAQKTFRNHIATTSRWSHSSEYVHILKIN